ncbi:MAG: ABC transporter ATP-binding protein [Oscillospiraceae bacterium]|nr:ABC transporter ATP-binding protein [Oscillospiraceae bacterium]
MIELRNATLGYPGKTVLRDVTLSFPAGQITVLLGPNGSGKSTLLKAILGLSQLQDGAILVQGKPLEAWDSAALARQVACLPQSRRVPDMTVERLVLHGRFPYLRYPRRYRPQDRAAARQAMEQVGILEYAGQELKTLSGGTRQKAYIAMALAQDTAAVLLDEPNAYLDLAHQLQLMALCRDLARQGKAVVVVLHDLNLALQYADRIALFANGTLLAQGTGPELCASGDLNQAFGVEVTPWETPQGTHYTFRLPRE